MEGENLPELVRKQAEIMTNPAAERLNLTHRINAGTPDMPAGCTVS
jgi:hypothetical protein